MKPCLIFNRVSKDDQHTENQLPECIAYAHQLGYNDEEIEIYTEKVSAYKNPERNTIRQVYNYKDVIVWRYDRLQRNREAFLRTIWEAHSQGTTIHSVRESWLQKIHNLEPPFNTIFYNLFIEFIGWSAEAESERISQRTKAGINRAREERGGRLPTRGCKHYNYELIWQYYQQTGSIRGAAKLSPYSYGTVRYIINNNIHDQATYERLRGGKKGEQKRGGEQKTPFDRP